MRTRVEIAGLLVALLVGALFLGSFFAGLGGADPQIVVADPEPQTAPEPPPEARVRVEVLNGAGRSGLARSVTGLLREAGFDVVYFGNAPGMRDSSVVLARIDDEAPARRIADRLSIGAVRMELDSTLQLEATVILGKDWPASR